MYTTFFVIDIMSVSEDDIMKSMTGKVVFFMDRSRMRENYVRNYKFMFQTIHHASRGRIAATIIFTAVSHLFSIFYSVLFLAYFMNAVSSKAGIREVSMKLYPSDRHEILNELDREKVYEDIYGWLLKCMAL